MKLATAKAIAGLVADEDLSEDNILPEAFDPRVADAVSRAVKRTDLKRQLAATVYNELLRRLILVENRHNIQTRWGENVIIPWTMT